MINQGLFTSNRDEWETPQALFDYLHDYHHFDFDLCANKENHKLPEYCSVEDSFLQGGVDRFMGRRIFCNPPYGRFLNENIERIVQISKVAERLVLLIPSRTDTILFHDWLVPNFSVIFLRGRLSYELNGVGNQPAPFPSLIAVTGEQHVEATRRACNAYYDIRRIR